MSSGSGYGKPFHKSYRSKRAGRLERFLTKTEKNFTEEDTMALSKELLDILACPKCVREPDCTGDLEYREQEQKLICHHCKLAYDIKDDIPVMLIDEASPLS